MAILFDDGSSEYLYTASAVLTDKPCTMACWFNTDDLTINETVMFLGDKDSEIDYSALRVSGSSENDKVQTYNHKYGGAAAKNALSGIGASANVWQHACGTWAVDGSLAAYLNGANKGTETGAEAWASHDATAIGMLRDSTPALPFSGMLADTAIWNVVLSDPEIAALGVGLNPLFVRPMNLVAYWPMRKLAMLSDIIGGYNMTAYNTPSEGTSHPATTGASVIAVQVAAAAAGASVPAKMRYYRNMRVA